MDTNQWTETFVQLLALASGLEAEGQYNLAKLTRAAADALARGAAHPVQLPTDKASLADELESAADALSRLGAAPDLLTALRNGVNSLRQERLALIDEAPHPYVCRNCGHLALGQAPQECPVCSARAETFQWFPPVYWLEALNPPDALKLLEQTPREVTRLLEGLSEEQMAEPAADGGWAVRNIVSHLRDAQGLISFRVDLFLKEELPVLESQAVFAWAAREGQSDSTREIFNQYRNSRQEMLAKLNALPCDLWLRTGLHKEFGKVTLQQQISYFALHECTHLPQIKTLRWSLLADPSG